MYDPHKAEEMFDMVRYTVISSPSFLFDSGLGVWQYAVSQKGSTSLYTASLLSS